MLQEMGVKVWLPASGVALLERRAAAVVPVAAPVPVPVPEAAPSAWPAHRVSERPSPLLVVGPTAATAWAGTVAPDLSLEASTDWSVLSDRVRNCQACALCGGRRHTTLLALADASRCDWMLVGDPPDQEEDRAGVPFAGPAGVLLHNMLRALGLLRANPDPAGLLQAPVAAQVPGVVAAAATRAYVTNVLKCRPAHGSVPQAAELAQCASHLLREIALVQPRMILSMGRFANQVLLAAHPELASLPLGKLRGTVHRYQGIPLVVTYPPSLLLRNSADKAKAWADLCLAATTLEK